MTATAKPAPAAETTPVAHNADIAQMMRAAYAAADIAAIDQFLEAHGALKLKIKPNGLYGAVTTDEEHIESGYTYTWLRDTVAVSVFQLETGNADIAAKTMTTLQAYFAKHRARFIGIIDGTADKNDKMQRPHIRFNGDTLEEVDQEWGHAQNDALGYSLWLACKLANEGHMPIDDATLADIWCLFPLFFRAVEYWQDAENGHWEEAPKIESSSIGAAMAGLIELKKFMNGRTVTANGTDVTPALIDDLIAKGREQLDAFLPWETREGLPGARRADGATLFLIYPLGVVTGEQADKVIATVTGELTGENGIKRYIGDSYWCADYKKLMSADELTTCTGQEDRDRHLKPGTEAQWCIFDPILSAIYGSRYLDNGDAADLARQTHFFNRALSQITADAKCPEAYYVEDSTKGIYVPNDQTPLAWTQANLGIALEYMKRTHAT